MVFRCDHHILRKGSTFAQINMDYRELQGLKAYCNPRCIHRGLYKNPEPYFNTSAIFSCVTGLITPRSQMMAVMRFAGVTSKAGL